MEFFQKILGLFKNRREDFLVFEELDDRIEVVSASVDSLEKKIVVRKKYPIGSFDDFQKPFWPAEKIVLAFDPGHATTIENVVALKRSDAKNVITESELDALVFRGLWDFLNHYRSWAAKKMRVSDLDLILANVEINDVKLGNHRVFNPLGFRSKDFSLTIRGTFVSRDLLPLIERYKKFCRNLYIVEGPSVLTSAIAGENDLAVHAGYKSSSVFVAREDERLFVKAFPWGAANVIDVIAKRFGVDEEVAELILVRYEKRQVSPRLSRLLEKLFREQFQAFLAMIEPIYDRLGRDGKSKTHVHFRFIAPPPDSFSSGLKIIPAVFHENLRQEGYDIISSKKARAFSPGLCQSVLAMLVYPYERPQYAFLNQLLKRRVKWLVPKN